MKDAYDALIVATGATEAVPPIPGLAEHGIGAWEVLKNEQLIPGGNVLVVGEEWSAVRYVNTFSIISADRCISR